MLAHEPDGIFLSNGPGDPEPLGYAIDNDSRGWSARSRSSASAWAISCSAWPWARKTFKLKFGHRGANQPVLNQRTNQVEITTQNHGFAVRIRRRCRADLEADAHQPERPDPRRDAPPPLPLFSVQYHPRPRPARTIAAICSRSFAR